MQQLFRFANFLADEAAKISTRYFRNQLLITNKADKSPVTIADQEIEAHLAKLIQQNYPTHDILGEEFSYKNNAAQYCWIIDPIDGTIAFSSGKPSFSTLIALKKDNQLMLGIIDQPIVKERFCAMSGTPATLNKRIICTSSTDSLAKAKLNVTTPLMFNTRREQESFKLLQAKVQFTAYGGDAYAFGLLAAGYIDLILEANLHYYDIAALIPIIVQSGGVISSWQGSPLDENFNGQCLASANPKLHQQALAIINNFN